MKSLSAISASLLALSSLTVALPSQPEKHNVGGIDLLKVSGLDEFKDGMYTLEYSTDGTPVITYTPVNATVASNVDSTLPAALSTRDTGCDGFSVDHSDTDAANSDLQRTCGSGRQGTLWFKRGNTVAFYCQYDQFVAKCTSESSQAADRWISDRCGSNPTMTGAGSYTGDGYAYGYTDFRYHTICGNWVQ